MVSSPSWSTSIGSPSSLVPSSESDLTTRFRRAFPLPASTWLTRLGLSGVGVTDSLAERLGATASFVSMIVELPREARVFVFG